MSCSSTYPDCCGAACVWTVNDPENCGGCGIKCSGGTPFCQGSLCVAQPCTPTPACTAGTSCCGTGCCAAGQICCSLNAPVGSMRALLRHAVNRHPEVPWGHRRQQRRLIINVLTSHHNFWFVWPLVGWGIAILFHFFGVFVFGKDTALYQRMVHREMHQRP